MKHKTCKGRTIKQRIFTPEPVFEMTLDAESWLSGVFPYDSRVLEPKLWNTFTRITLVNRQMCERVTLDVDVNFSPGQPEGLPGRSGDCRGKEVCHRLLLAFPGRDAPAAHPPAWF